VEFACIDVVTIVEEVVRPLRPSVCQHQTHETVLVHSANLIFCQDERPIPPGPWGLGGRGGCRTCRSLQVGEVRRGLANLWACH
jgi:hypothetical protein